MFSICDNVLIEKTRGVAGDISTRLLFLQTVAFFWRTAVCVRIMTEEIVLSPPTFQEIRSVERAPKTC